jgi:phospholipase C
VTNSNPGVSGTPNPVTSFAFANTAQSKHASQSWNATHEQINGGRMDGFVKSVSATQPMGYYPPGVVPFAYSLARTFTVANRWFCSVPGPTKPNRRFLLAGTAYGGTITNISTLKDRPPPNGTIFDRLHTCGVSWRDYFTDVPQTAIIPDTVTRYPDNHSPIAASSPTARTTRCPRSASSIPVSGRCLRSARP